MLQFTQRLMWRLIRDEKGLAAVEYAVLGGFVVAAIAAVGASFTTELQAAFTNLFASIP